MFLGVFFKLLDRTCIGVLDREAGQRAGAASGEGGGDGDGDGEGEG